MITLGLDPSLTGYGWCIHDSDASNKSRRIASGRESTKTNMVPVSRFIQFRKMVSSLIHKYNPSHVGIESPAYDGPFQVIHHGLM